MLDLIAKALLPRVETLHAALAPPPPLRVGLPHLLRKKVRVEALHLAIGAFFGRFPGLPRETTGGCPWLRPRHRARAGPGAGPGAVGGGDLAPLLLLWDDWWRLYLKLDRGSRRRGRSADGSRKFPEFLEI